MASGPLKSCKLMVEHKAFESFLVFCSVFCQESSYVTYMNAHFGDWLRFEDLRLLFYVSLYRFFVVLSWVSNSPLFRSESIDFSKLEGWEIEEESESEMLLYRSLQDASTLSIIIFCTFNISASTFSVCFVKGTLTELSSGDLNGRIVVWWASPFGSGEDTDRLTIRIPFRLELAIRRNR